MPSTLRIFLVWHCFVVIFLWFYSHFTMFFGAMPHLLGDCYNIIIDIEYFLKWWCQKIGNTLETPAIPHFPHPWEWQLKEVFINDWTNEEAEWLQNDRMKKNWNGNCNVEFPLKISKKRCRSTVWLLLWYELNGCFDMDVTLVGHWFYNNFTRICHWFRDCFLK